MKDSLDNRITSVTIDGVPLSYSDATRVASRQHKVRIIITFNEQVRVNPNLVYSLFIQKIESDGEPSSKPAKDISFSWNKIGNEIYIDYFFSSDSFYALKVEEKNTLMRKRK